MDYNIRRWKPTDIDALVKQMNNIHIWSSLSEDIPFPATAKIAKNYLDKFCQKGVEYDIYAIEVDNDVVGGISFSRLKPPFTIIYRLQFWLCPDFWEESFIEEALAKLIKNTFFHLPVMKIISEILENDVKSIQVLEKLGFEKEATLQKVVLKSGSVKDLYFYTLAEENFDPSSLYL